MILDLDKLKGRRAARDKSPSEMASGDPTFAERALAKYGTATIRRLKIGTILAVIAGVILWYMLFSALAAGVAFAPIDVFAKKCISNGFPGGSLLVSIALLVAVTDIGIIKLFVNNKPEDALGRSINYEKETKAYGDAHFLEPEEYLDCAKISNISKAEGPILGMRDNEGKEVINTRLDTRLNRHTVAFGGSGAGKTFSFVKPNCYQIVKRRESVILTDPDGGLFRDMAGYFQDNGYVVRRFDVKNPEKSDGWNCMQSCIGPNLDNDIAVLAKTIIDNTCGGEDTVYSNGARALLTALMLYVANSPSYIGNRNLSAVDDMLILNDIEALDAKFEIAATIPLLRTAYRNYMTFKTASPNLKGNIFTNLKTYLSDLNNPVLRQILETDTIDPSLPGVQPCAYFCIFPETGSAGKLLSNLFFTSLMQAQITSADANPDGRNTVPINYMLDEFVNTGRYSDFARLTATVRKRNIHITIICQNITQLQAVYNDDWDTIVDNCDTMYVLSINNQATAQYISDRIGKATIEVSTYRHEVGSPLFKAPENWSTGLGQRALLNIDEIIRLSREHAIILYADHGPILANLVPHTLHPESQKLRPFYSAYIPDISDEDERQSYIEMQDALVKRWYLTHPEVKCPDTLEIEGSLESYDAIIADWFRANKEVTPPAFIKDLLDNGAPGKPESAKPAENSVIISDLDLSEILEISSAASAETEEPQRETQAQDAEEGAIAESEQESEPIMSVPEPAEQEEVDKNQSRNNSSAKYNTRGTKHKQYTKHIDAP